MKMGRIDLLIIEDNVSYYVGMENDKEIAEIAEPIKLTGIDRVLKYKTQKVEIVTPGEFIRRMEESDDE